MSSHRDLNRKPLEYKVVMLASHHTLGKLHKNHFTEVWENYIDISLRPPAETGLTREARRLYPSYIHIANNILLL